VVSEPGPLLARGRAADVYALDRTRVLRRYRRPSCTPREVAVMERARADGYPVPRVHDLTETDLVMDRIEGPTMVDDMARRPWRLRQHARTLASLHHRLHDIPAPQWLDTPLGDGAVLIHLDLHPLNVILGPDGPVVIDWSNAARGDGNADVALTWLLIMTGRPDEGAFTKLLAAVGRSLFARPFLSRFVRAEVMAHLDAAGGYKLADPNMSAVEQRAIRRLVANTRR
jgi:aminoglycoside phosphotransferase (APT) family kinase protein